MKLKSFLLFVTIIQIVVSSKILIVFHFPSPSHYHLGSALAKGLVKAGHDVTILSPFKDSNPPKSGKYREIVMTGYLEEFLAIKDRNLFEFGNVNKLQMALNMNNLGIETTTKTLEHPAVQNLLKSGETFDAVIMQQFFNDALKAFAYHFNASLILFNSIGANVFVNSLVANPNPPSYVPDMFLSYSDKMTFFQRLHNTVFYLATELYRHMYFFPTQNQIMMKYFPDAPHLNELLYNSSLVLLNSDISIGYPIPLAPSMVNIGGFHVNLQRNSLPENLENFINGAKDGVIYFSMGTNIRIKDLPMETIQTLLKTFGELKERIIWKSENVSLARIPPNVLISKWLPQQDILAHPKTKLFVTHGGLLSITETIYHGVPILAIPVFNDQAMNAAQVELSGCGIVYNIKELGNKLKFETAIRTLLDNPKYRENAKTRSILMHDKPVKQLDNAIWWIEYVIRHKGAKHLRVASLELSWYQYFLVDVFVFVLIIPIVFVVIVHSCLKQKETCKKNNDKKKIKKQ